MEKMLEVLAAKLGTSVDYLWPLFIKKVQIESAGYLLLGTVAILLGLYAVKLLVNRVVKNEEKEPSFDVVGSWFGIVVILFNCAFIAGGLVSQVTNLIIPEPEALRKIMSLLG